jgi:hypothetical protein
VGNDANVMIDGIRLSNKDGHSALLFTGVNKSAVQQLSVETGVTSAEYGDAQAGTVNIVTQEGGKDLHGWMEFGYEPPGKKHWGANIYDSPIHRDHMKWNDPAWANETDPVTGRRIHVREDYTGVSGYRMEGSLSGPIGSKASFLASLKHEGRAATLPSATRRGFYDDRGQFITAPRNVQGSASLTVKPTENTKVKAGLILQRYTAWNNETTERVSGLARGLDEEGRNIFLPKDWGAAGRYRFREELEYLTFTHTLSPKTFYEVRVAHGRTKQDTVGVSFVTQNPRRDKDGWFNIGRQTGAWILSDRQRWSLKADLSSQITKGHFLKTGFELMRFDAWYVFWLMLNTQDVWMSFYSGGDRPYEMRSPASPIRGAYYLQDKMEFEGLIVNAGVRLDYQFHTHRELISPAFAWAPMWRRYTTRHYAYGVGDAGPGVSVSGSLAATPPAQFVISPRLGISHPVTDRLALHCSLGRFVQWADLYDQYVKTYQNNGQLGPDRYPWQDLNGNKVMDPAENLNVLETKFSGFDGDPWGRPEETLTFEVGADWNFVSDYTAALTVFYRSETQQFSYNPNNRWQGPQQGRNYSRAISNALGGYAKGVEVSVSKRLSHAFSFRVGWSSMWTAEGRMGLGQGSLRVYPDSSFVVSEEFWYKFTVNPDGSETATALTPKEKTDFGIQARRDVESAIGTSRFKTEAYPKNGAPAPGQTPYDYVGLMPNVGNQEIYGQYLSTGGAQFGPLAAQQGAEKVGGRLGQANVQFVLNTPSGVRSGPGWMGWLVSDLNANVLWRMRTGRRFNWTPPEGQLRRERGPIDSAVDLSVEKVFNAKGRVNPSFFVEVRNLFNDRSDPDSGPDYVRWGLQTPRPDDANFLKYGDPTEANYVYPPRQVNLGVRVTF